VASAKQAVRDILRQLPEDCTLEDVQYQLYVRQKLEKSRAAAAQGRLLPHEEVKKRLSKWLAK
jgi:predicted transcriptional regulator